MQLSNQVRDSGMFGARSPGPTSSWARQEWSRDRSRRQIAAARAITGTVLRIYNQEALARQHRSVFQMLLAALSLIGVGRS